MADKSFLKEKKDAKWFANFWYYYKNAFLVGLIVVALALYGCVSCARTVDYDFEMYYFGFTTLSDEVFDKAEKYFSEYANDVDGKDGVNVSCVNLRSVDDENISGEIDYAMNSKIQIEIAEGEGYFYLMPESWAKYCVENELMEDISYLTGDENAVYVVDVTENPILNSLGFKTDEKLYAGVRMLNNNRVGKDKYENKHNNALKIIKYLISKNN